MKENWKMMQMDGQMDALMQQFDGDEENLEMLIFDLSDKLDQDWEKNEDFLRLGVADEFVSLFLPFAFYLAQELCRWATTNSFPGKSTLICQAFCLYFRKLLSSSSQRRIAVWRAF